jgi:uncharacterized repeat protein (TIGR03803 family)
MSNSLILVALTLITCAKLAAAQVFQEIYSFQLFGTNGDGPYGGLVEAGDGNFYGTTFYGGTWDYGTIFRMRPDGVVTAIASFDATNTDQHPYTALVQGNDDNFYGSTGGALFSVTPAGRIAVVGGGSEGDLYSAPDRCLYGSDPAYDVWYGGFRL